MPEVSRKITKRLAALAQRPKSYNRLADFLADNNVQCTACNARQIGSTQGNAFGGAYAIRCFTCLGCGQVNIEIAEERTLEATRPQFVFVSTIFRYPIRTRDFALPDACSGVVSEDYREAVNLLRMSPRASAAFARRCLQTILREQGYSQRDLVDQISALLEEMDLARAVPHYVTSSVDAIRNFGNFSVHPVENKNTAALIDVEAGEAEW